MSVYLITCINGWAGPREYPTNPILFHFVFVVLFFSQSGVLCIFLRVSLPRNAGLTLVSFILFFVRSCLLCRPLPPLWLLSVCGKQWQPPQPFISTAISQRTTPPKFRQLKLPIARNPTRTGIHQRQESTAASTLL